MKSPHTSHLVPLTLVVLGLMLGSIDAVPATPVTVEVSPQLPTTQDNLMISVTGLGQPAAFSAPAVMGNEIVVNGTSSATGTRSAHFVLGPLTAGGYTVQVVLDGAPAADLSLEVSTPRTELDLDNERFAVFATWVDTQGIRHDAKTVKLSDNSGYFWFFDSTNVEVTIKILDGRLVNNHFWVFIASMTNVQFSVDIFDPFCLSFPPPCSPLREYNSPAGRNRNFIDLGSL
jgi:hypothetical protein